MVTLDDVQTVSYLIASKGNKNGSTYSDLLEANVTRQRDCDEIPKDDMFLNLEVMEVRLRFSDPMIQTDRRDLPRISLVRGRSPLGGNQLQPPITKIKCALISLRAKEDHHKSHLGHLPNFLTNPIPIMRIHAEYEESNTYVLERFNTSAGNPVKKILLKLNLSDHRLCKMVVELKNFKKDATLKLFKNGMSMSVQKSQVHKVAKLQDGVEIVLGYNNLRVFEQEIQGALKTSSSAQNVAFVSQSKSSTNKVKSGFTSSYSTCTPSTSSTNIPEKEVCWKHEKCRSLPKL
ncbi:hypothetical protein Tco_0889503 [Tanacetum coccineum]